MEKLTFQYTTSQRIKRSAHIGVVGSGDLEVMIEPLTGNKAEVAILTGSDGFEKVWERVLSRFFNRYPISAKVTIHDFGATPGVVYLRLTQALEAVQHAE